jgi:hypothetical protein
MKKLFKVFSPFVVVLMILSTACAGGTTAASCAFIVGNGTSGYDAKVHKVIYPGQSVPVLEHENVYYVPCNSRNFIVNDGSIKDANGKPVGDQSQLITATTANTVSITIAARALWTLNEDPKAMANFYTVCFKYTCYSKDDKGGDANFSTAGWNGMLQENFGPAMSNAARVAAHSANDSIWQAHDPDQYKALADGMSATFADQVRANFGFPENLFCGSGNSQWSDPAKPGVGEFNCAPVRFIVDDVQQAKAKADDNTQSATALNQQRLKNAQALYGDSAGYWLGLQDTINQCKGAGATCVINIGGANSSTAVQVPAANN